MDKLLVKLKRLAKQYKDSDSVALDIAHIRKEKLRAYELQILFRMELIERDCDGPLDQIPERYVDSNIQFSSQLTTATCIRGLLQILC